MPSGRSALSGTTSFFAVAAKRVMVSDYAIGTWQITRETLRAAHQLYLKDKRDYRLLPARLRPPRALDLNSMDDAVLTNLCRLLLLRGLLDHFGAATSTRPPAPTTAASALPIPPTPPASRPSPFTPAASSSTPLLWTIPQPTRRILRSLLRSRPLRPRHPQRLLRSKNSPGVSPTTESFQSLSALHIASLLKPASFPFTKHETTDQRRPGLPCSTITCKNGENISCNANYGLYLIAAAGHQ